MVRGKVVAVIPARGGSKRVPKKNIMDFNGKPLIAWTIEAALKSNVFDKIVVSTDSPEIAEISRQYGAEVPALRDDKADDFSPISEATVTTLNQLKNDGYQFEEVIQLMAVCPLRTADDILDAYNHFKHAHVPFQISCYKYVWMNPWWAGTLDGKGHPSWIFENARKRSQDLPNLYSPTGAIWIATVEDLCKEGTFYGKGHIFWEMNWKRAVDIDNYEDFFFASSLKKLDES